MSVKPKIGKDYVLLINLRYTKNLVQIFSMKVGFGRREKEKRKV